MTATAPNAEGRISEELLPRESGSAWQRRSDLLEAQRNERRHQVLHGTRRPAEMHIALIERVRTFPEQTTGGL